MGIKNRLNNLLQDRHITAGELASQINVTPSTIYSILQRDSSRIDCDLLVKIANGLNVTTDELLDSKRAALSHDKCVKQKGDFMSYKRDVEMLIEEIESVRILSGALFDKFANDGDYDKAIIFQMLRDTFREKKVALESLIAVNK